MLNRRALLIAATAAVWEGLVRQAFKDFNASIVSEFKKAWKPA